MALPEWTREQLPYFFELIRNEYDEDTEQACRAILKLHPEFGPRPFRALHLHLDQINARELADAAHFRELASNS